MRCPNYSIQKLAGQSIECFVAFIGPELRGTKNE